MIKKFFCFLAFMLPCALFAQEQTLRVDYIFTGTDKTAEISLDQMSCYDGWAGRRTNMKEVPVRGNGQICMTDAQTGDTLYRMSFSTLFQEWQTTEEATRVRRSFEGVYLLPMPEVKANVDVQLFDFYGNIAAQMRHGVDPKDVLIRKQNPTPAPHKYIMSGGSPEECIDVVIVAEGYTEAEMDVFYADAQETVNA